MDDEVRAMGARRAPCEPQPVAERCRLQAHPDWHDTRRQFVRKLIIVAARTFAGATAIQRARVSTAIGNQASGAE